MERKTVMFVLPASDFNSRNMSSAPPLRGEKDVTTAPPVLTSLLYV